MKKIAIGLIVVVVAALAVVGFSPKYSAQDLTAKLHDSWEGHTERDVEFRESFFDLVGKVAMESEHVREKFASYKDRLSITDDHALVNTIFLLRRAVDKDSFYRGMEEFAALSEETQDKVIAKFGPTYRVVADGSLEDNQELVDILAKRKTDLAGVVSALGETKKFAIFGEVVATLEPTEVPDYLECLYLMMLNTVAVRKFIGQTNAEPVAVANDRDDL